MAISATAEQERATLHSRTQEEVTKLTSLQQRIKRVQLELQQELDTVTQQLAAVQLRKTQNNTLVTDITQQLNDELAKLEKAVGDDEQALLTMEKKLPELVSRSFLYRMKVNFFRVGVLTAFHEHPIKGKNGNTWSTSYIHCHDDRILAKLFFGNINPSNVHDRAQYILGWTQDKRDELSIPFPTSHPSLHGWTWSKHHMWQPPGSTLR